MSGQKKNQEIILKKLGIEALNSMQEAAKEAIHTSKEVVLLSPTGTGKTLAFLLPLIQELESDKVGVQILILVPSRELAIQIEQVLREMGTGYKANAVYGGRSFSKDLLELAHPPSVLIGTPGRVADHMRRDSFTTESIKVLVLDEFDKSLETGFEGEMKEITGYLGWLQKKVLTSATQKVEIPEFVGLTNPNRIDFLLDGISTLAIKRIVSPSNDKRKTLVAALHHIGNNPGIVFCNFKDTIREVSDYLTNNGIDHGCFFGGMEQKDRERALIKFRNGTHQLIVATDLAARGLDIPELSFILHYELPHHADEFTHRNGRTARMMNNGTAYVLQAENENLPEFIGEPEIETLTEENHVLPTNWRTVFVSGGRKDKISKGDIAGLFFKQGNLNKDELGVIELKQDCAFVGVKASKVEELVEITNNTRLKKKKVRIFEI